MKLLGSFQHKIEMKKAHKYWKLREIKLRISTL